MFSNKTVIGLTLLSLTLLLSGCATTATQRVTPPAHLLADCPYPDPGPVVSNGDLIRLLPQWRQALDNCNADKAGLRAWAEGTP